jgi:transglutaminase-like putative cysteine protease
MTGADRRGHEGYKGVMQIRVGYDIIHECAAPTPMLLMLSLRPERQADLITPQVMSLDPWTPSRTYIDRFGNLCTRLVAPAGLMRLSADFLVADSGLPDQAGWGAIQHEVDDLPSDLLTYLLGSRYCETDQLIGPAWSLFGGIAPGWGRVQAIVEWVHDRLTFGYPYARATRTAWEAFNERVGVCRDFAHLTVALCRCMNIPTRYCTGWLPDIGVPVELPMDFSAWVEVYLGGRWHTIDARHSHPRVGRILMAHGRDATDTAISTAFGPTILTRFDVIAETA